MKNRYIYKQVSAVDIINEKELLNEYSISSKSSLMPTHIPDKDMYIELEKKGLLKSFAVYNENKMIGFITCIMTVMPHYSEMCATIESLFVSKEHRKFGTAKRLLGIAEQEAKDNECVAMFMSAPIGGRLELATKGLGFTPTHITYTKKIEC